MLEISTSNLNTRKKVEIDGHPYTVRRLGAGDELAISQIIRRTEALIKKAEKKDGSMTDKEEQEFIDLQEQSLKIYASTFDDGGDGSKAYDLISSLSYTERAMLYDQIFEVKRDTSGSNASEIDS